MPCSLATRRKPPGRLAHLGDRARSRAELRRVERLDGVDDADVGPLALERRADDVEIRLGEDEDVARAAEPLGPELHLGRRLLAGDEHGLALAAHGPQGHQEQRRLADTGVAADEHEATPGRGRRRARGRAPATPVGDPFGFGRFDLDEAEQRPAVGLRRRGRRCGRRSAALLDEGPPLPARGTAAEPLAGRVPALGARVLEGHLRHGRPSLGRRSDAEARGVVPDLCRLRGRGSWPSRPRTPRRSGFPASAARRASRASRTCRPRAERRPAGAAAAACCWAICSS